MKVFHTAIYRSKLLLFMIALLISFSAASQTYLKIMPLGNSITYDTFSLDLRPVGEKTSYRYQLYQSLLAAGYTFDYVGSESNGGTYLPTASPDYTNHAGFPGITAAQLRVLLQTGRNYVIDPVNGFCELPSCPQNYLQYYSPDVILLHIGTNGLSTNTDADSIADDVKDILNVIDAYETWAGKTVPVFLARIINRGGASAGGNHAVTTYYNTLLDALVASRPNDSIIQVNLETGAGIDYRLSPPGNMIDVLHPAASGYTKMGTTWYNVIETYNIATPVVSDIVNQTKTEGSSFTVLLDDFVFDPQDRDADMTWTFTGNSNLSVSINASHVATITPLNTNWNGSETITFRATDPFAAFASDAATFTLTAVNDPPADISLSGTAVPENQVVGTIVGTLSTTDADIGDVFTYSLVSGTGSADNGSFTILSNSLITNAVFDYETKSSYLVRIRTTDSGGDFYEEAFTISVTNVNETPVLSNIEPSALNYAELTGPVSVTSAITVADDNANLPSATIRITTGYQQTEDVLSYPIEDGFATTWNATTGTFTLLGSYSLAVYQAALRNIKYTNTSADPVTTTRVVTFTVNDGEFTSTAVTRNITIGSVNNAPVLSNLETEALSFTENEAAKNISDLIAITDIDDTSLETATVTLSSNYQNGQDVLAFTNANGISGSWNAGTGTLTLTGTATIANYRTALRSISYQNTSESPSVLTRTVTFTISDGELASNAVSRNITVTAVNDVPVLSGIESIALAYNEGDGAENITATLTLTDADNTGMQSAAVTISSGYQSTQDVLSFVNANGITGSWNSATGVLTLTGTSLVANYQTALHNVMYENSSDNPVTTTRTITFRVNDGTANSNTVSRNITIGALNDPPLLSSIETTALPYTENTIATDITGTLIVTDNDDTSLESASVRISANYQNGEDVLSFTNIDGITGSWNAATGILSLTGTSLVINYRNALRNVAYRNTSENPSVLVRTVSFTVNDGTSASNTVTRNINVTAVNDAPVLTGIEATALAYTAGAGEVTVSATISAADTDNVNLASATVRITGNYIADQDRLRFTNANGITGFWNNTTGTLSLSGVTTLANYRTALRNVRYENINTTTPNTTARTVQFLVNDGGSVNGASNAVIRTISYVPTATISGGGDLCGTALKDTVILTLTGEPNWTVVIRRTGGPLPKDTTISNITLSPYSIYTSVAGTYTVNSVADNNYPDGLEYGTATISVRPNPTARLTGTSQICLDSISVFPMTVDFTGTSPWTFKLRRNAEDTTYTNVTPDPFNFTRKLSGIYKIISLADRYCQGDTVAGFGTAVASYITSPKAGISGVDTVCPGDTATLQIQLEGEGPFSITYLRNGANARTINNITQITYALKVVGDGNYTLSAVSDQVRSGCVSGTGKVVYYSSPTATISGSGAICEHTTANLRVTFTGTSPWNFSYHRNTEVPTSVTNVTASPRFIIIDKSGTYTLVNVSDKYCNGTVSGNAVVTVTLAPDVSITGLEPAYSIKELKVPVFGNPEGGTFTPPVLIPINDTNYFLPNLMGVGLHTLVYSYRDDGTGCYGYDTAVIAVLDADAEITFPENDTKKLFCNNGPPFTILGHNIKNDTGTFMISGGIGLVDNHNNTATINPSQLNGGTFVVTYRYFDNTFLEVTEEFEIESVDNIWFINFDETSFCDNAIPVRLTGNAATGIFSGKAVTGNLSSGFYFEPRLSTPGMDTVFYTFTTVHGCSRQIFKSLVIRDAADINFTVQDTCFSPLMSDSTVFINLTATTDEVKTWAWEFDDVSSGSNNSSGLKNPRHRYTKDGLRIVKLTANTDYCESKKSILFRFGEKPKADFEWANECFHEGQKIRFTNKSYSGNPDVIIDSYKWKFYRDDETYDSISTRNAEYPYNTPGNYRVVLFIHSNYGCTDEISKSVPLKPTYVLKDDASPYFEDFEGDITGWVSTSDDTARNSWNLGLPVEAGYNSAWSGVNCWFTDIKVDDEGRALEEQSAVTFPCFDFTEVRKPMIRFYMWRLFNIDLNDGAVLQYKADTGKEWKHNIGDLNDGIHWYQDYKISGKPGGQPIGWSSKGSPDNGWVEARHSLDELKGMTDIQLRIAYGSDGTAKGTRGIAFDDVRIGERNKIVLVEHFTNSSDDASMTADAALDALANANPLDIVDIQYHTSFPGEDPFNQLNKVDPGTRVLLYQLSDVPVSIVNGGSGENYRFDYDNNPLDPNKIKIQSLTNPKFSITLQTTLVNNTLTVDAELRPIEPIINQQVTLHIAIIERKISGVTGANGDTLFESVLKTILSSTSYTNNWDPAVDFKTVTKNWSFKNTYNTDEVRVIAFVQDEATQEVYQAMIDKFDLQLALEEEHVIHRSNAGTGFIAFPNPVYDEVFIRFDEVVVKSTLIDLFDINGKLLMTKELFPGNKQYGLSLGDFPDGFYFLRITSDNHFIGLQKLVISR